MKGGEKNSKNEKDTIPCSVIKHTYIKHLEDLIIKKLGTETKSCT